MTAIITIRAFQSGDLPVMQHIRAAAFHPVFQSFRTIVGDRIAALALAEADAEQAQLLEDICKPDSPHHVLVASKDSEIVGFFSYTLDAPKRIGEIGLNAVHPDHAGHGIGTEMYDYALARMKEAGMAVATVGTGGDPSHAPARRAYEKAGFGPAIPSVYMYKLL
jgi:GNAT superfamily N-acetyltransferase